MTRTIRSEFVLPALQILLDPQRTDFTQAVFRMAVGDSSPNEVARCSLADLGLPPTLSGLNPVDEETLTIPPAVLDALARATEGLGESPQLPHDALWLEFPSPRGSLYLMPWERLLAPLRRPALRLPRHVLQPLTRAGRLTVAICVTTSQKTARLNNVGEVLDGLITQYRTEQASRAVTIHVFTDASWSAEVMTRFGGHADVVVHPAGTAPATDRGPGSASPWLAWMRNSLGPTPIDWVHVLGLGCLTGDRGALAVAASPAPETPAQRFGPIGPAELTAFLTQVGAWGLALSGPGGDSSDVGLRELADAIARLRPGVTVQHCLDTDPVGAEFGRALGDAVFRPKEALRQPLPSTTCWVQTPPAQYPAGFRERFQLAADGTSALLGEATRSLVAQPDAPMWLASACRVVESQQMRWLPESTGSAAPDADAVNALRNVAELIERHVRHLPARSAKRGTP